jgi:hypothetical protein
MAKMIWHSTIDVLIRHYAGWIDSATAEYESRLKEAFRPLEQQGAPQISRPGTKSGIGSDVRLLRNSQSRMAAGGVLANMGQTRG